MTRLLLIEPGRSKSNYWRDLWHYRELFQVLAWRDLAVHYRQTIIGVLWAVIRPLLAMIILSLVFGSLAKLPSDGNTPYPLFVFAGILPWSFFSTALSDAANSLITGENVKLISKVYFPRLIVPAAAVIVGLVDLSINIILFFGLMVWYGAVVNTRVLLLPVFVVICFLTSFGFGTWIAALNVKYRDFRYVVPFILQVGIYASPVGFSSKIVPSDWRLVYSLNPLVGIIDGFRWCLLGDEVQIYWPGVILSVSVTLVTLWVGVRAFRKLERSFADLI